jgi:amidohydrolase
VTGSGELLAQAGELSGDVVALRRQLHRFPEIGLDLPSTQATVIEHLEPLPLSISTGTGLTSVVAVLTGDLPGPRTLLRGDMDALPITEENDLEFASQHHGVMHACGHDAHTAMLVGAATLLAERRRQLEGTVVFMFQPGEEGHFGAPAMLDEGLIEDHGPFDRAFALHTSPLYPVGTVATRVGTFMASSDRFRIVVTGRGGHAAAPHQTVDPVPVACEIVTAFQAMITRRVNVFDPAVLTVTRLIAGTAFNVIPSTASIEGTFRAVSDAGRVEVTEGIRRVAAGVAEAHGCSAEVVLVDRGFPRTVNDASAVEFVLDRASQLVHPDHVEVMESPAMGAEDWSFVLRAIPGAMTYLGTGRPDDPDPAPNHSPHMYLDESALALGVALHAAMVLGGARSG